MTLPVSGPLSFNAINVELGTAGTTQASMGQASYRTLAGVASGQIAMNNFYGKSNYIWPQTALYYAGAAYSGNVYAGTSNIINYITNTGTVGADNSTTGISRYDTGGGLYGSAGAGVIGTGVHYPSPAYSYAYDVYSSTGIISASGNSISTYVSMGNSCCYGGDKHVFAFGLNNGSQVTSQIFKVTNTGVMSASGTNAGTARTAQSNGVNYGGKNLGLFWAGQSGGNNQLYVMNYVNSSGDVGSNQTAFGTARFGYASMPLGDQGLLAFGQIGNSFASSHSYGTLVSNTGTFVSETDHTNAIRANCLGTAYGGNKGIVCYGYVNGTGWSKATVLISNTNVWAADSTSLGSQSHQYGTCAPYGPV